MELRRSIFSEITVDALKTTIILNARTLMEKDADFAKFAARMLLTYIYEEVLGWSIVATASSSCRTSTAVPSARTSHVVSRSSASTRRLLKYDLDKLARRARPRRGHGLRLPRHPDAL
jgi:ribonucleoside-diphosphate reductase alpha chain